MRIQAQNYFNATIKIRRHHPIHIIIACTFAQLLELTTNPGSKTLISKERYKKGRLCETKKQSKETKKYNAPCVADLQFAPDSSEIVDPRITTYIGFVE